MNIAGYAVSKAGVATTSSEASRAAKKSRLVPAEEDQTLRDALRLLYCVDGTQNSACKEPRSETGSPDSGKQAGKHGVRKLPLKKVAAAKARERGAGRMRPTGLRSVPVPIPVPQKQGKETPRGVMAIDELIQVGEWERKVSATEMKKLMSKEDEYVNVKAGLGGELRRVTVPSSISYTNFVGFMKEAFGVKQDRKIGLWYLDVEGDRVVVSGELDTYGMMFHARQKRIDPVRVQVEILEAQRWGK